MAIKDLSKASTQNILKSVRKELFPGFIDRWTRGSFKSLLPRFNKKTQKQDYSECLCIVGAVSKACGLNPEYYKYREVTPEEKTVNRTLNALVKALPENVSQGVQVSSSARSKCMTYNDESMRTSEDIKIWLDRAIEAA